MGATEAEVAAAVMTDCIAAKLCLPKQKLIWKNWAALEWRKSILALVDVGNI